tara:strand:- start:308 stop:952 length:645 start_codon:yes stop_codon:yes gene_type:complete
MEPITLALLTAAAGATIKNAPSLIKSDLEKEQEKRLRELRKREATGGLGLTEEERAAIEGRLNQGAYRVQQQAGQERARLLAGGGGARGGQALEQATAMEQQRMQQQTDVAQNVLELDIAEKQAERDEMMSLQAADSEMNKARQQAVANIAAGGLEAALGASQQQAVMQGGLNPSASQVSAVSNAMGVDENQARGFLELAVTNPEIFELLKLIQ